MTTSNILKVATVQHPCSANPAENMQRSIEGIREAGSRGAQLVLLQELHGRPYFCQQQDPEIFNWAETIPGPTTLQLSSIAKELAMVIVGSVFERRASGVYHNTAVIIDRNGNIAGKYRKMHIPDDPGYHEKYYFTPGDTGFEPVMTSVGRLGVMLCWDQWFPEAARIMALKGAEILLYPTAIGWDPKDSQAQQLKQIDAWTTVQRSHAIANALPVVACNRIGLETDPSGHSRGIQFWGSSFITGAQGEILAQANSNQTEILIMEIDLNQTETLRRTWPYLRDRRIDAYHDILLRYRES